MDDEWKMRKEDAMLELDDDGEMYVRSVVISLFKGLQLFHDRHVDKEYWKIVGRDELIKQMLKSITKHMHLLDIDKMFKDLKE